MTTYPQVQLYAGQHVAILAGGCVQTGGHGKTWRRYVNPFIYFDGSSIDNFHGTIWIPGTTLDDIVELRYLQGATLTVNETTPLRLGYIDDDYSDNGYWGRAGDDGPGDQCKGYSNAWVYLTIT